MAQKINFSPTIEPTLKGMEVGDMVYFPIARLKSVLSICSLLNAALSRKYKSQRHTALGYVQVTRES